METNLIYEKNQDFNFINKYLHSFRFKWIVKIVNDIRKNKKQGDKITIVDMGCGTCKLFEVLNDLAINFEYIGIEPLD